MEVFLLIIVKVLATTIWQSNFKGYGILEVEKYLLCIFRVEEAIHCPEPGPCSLDNRKSLSVCYRSVLLFQLSCQHIFIHQQGVFFFLAYSLFINKELQEYLKLLHTMG